ncbi:MAG TPA: tetratricopeptide repeat protein, partial [Campylobacterales bacterium]|nr:tetratricopeptide repeat protein [Campylobacterales bacterium]
MHSSVNNHDTSTSILSLKEIMGIIMVFSFVLYLLFPKEDIELIVEGESKNTNLSINYLESMLLYYPDNIKLQMALIKNYRYAGDLNKALKLTDKLLNNTTDKELQKSLYKSQYMILKDQYFQLKNEEEKIFFINRLKEKLLNYFNIKGEKKEYLFLFAEATQMGFQALKYKALKGLMREEPDFIDYELEKEAFYLASALEFKEEAQFYLFRLLEYGEIEGKLKERALTTLLEAEEYNRASALATQLFLENNDSEIKIAFFNIALYTLFQDEANNTEAIKKLIKTYASSGVLKAHNVSVVIEGLLKVGDTKGASQFAMDTFKSNPESFNEKVTELAIKSLIYRSELKSALHIALLAHKKFPKRRWLDQSIQLCLWLGEMKKVTQLNHQGYKLYGDLKYEAYLLKSTTLDNGYKLLEEIYKNRLKKGDLKMVKKIAEYYNYTGEIPKAETYFLKQLKKRPNQAIHKEAILFSYKNSHYAKGIRLYEQYKKRYGMEKKLQKLTIKKLLALKQFKKAYHFSKALANAKKHTIKIQATFKKLGLNNSFPFYRKIIELAWIQKDYPYLYKILWKLEHVNELKSSDYEKLIHLEKALNQGERVAYLYEKSWKKTSNQSYLFALFYKYIEDKNIPKFQSLLKKLTPKDKKSLKKSIHYHILMANHYVQNQETQKALKSFITALKLDKNSAFTHQAYLWFLLDNKLSKKLIKEIRLLRKSPKLQAQVGFPSVVGAMTLQKTDLALRWLKPLLKTNENRLEYQILYADILELQDRAIGAKYARIKLFKKINQMIKSSPKLLKDKDFARVYMRLVTLYVTPYEKRAIYFKQFKSLFANEDYLEMQISWYASKGETGKVKELVSKNSIDIPWLSLYLAIGLDHQLKKQKLLKEHKEILPFRDRVTATLDTGDRSGAYSLAFQSLEENSRDTDLYKIYHNMVNTDYPKGEVSTKYKHLSPKITSIQNRVSYRWGLYKGIESKLSVEQYRYHLTNNKKNNLFINHVVTLSLKNRFKKLLWNAKVSQHDTQHDFLSASLDLKYRTSDFTVEVATKYQNQTEQTPQLQIEGMENAVKVSVKKSINGYMNLGISYEEKKYKRHDRTNIGSSRHIALNANHIIRAGYPDITLNGYISLNRYHPMGEEILLPKSYTEFGLQLSMGMGAKNYIHRSWKPFGTLGVAVNNHQNIGTSLSLGMAGKVRGEDLLYFQFDYSNGVKMINDASYAVQ